MAHVSKTELRDFMDAWFALRPRVYNQFFDSNNGNAHDMFDELSLQKPQLADQIQRNTRLVTAKRLTAGKPGTRRGSRKSSRTSTLGNVGIA